MKNSSSTNSDHLQYLNNLPDLVYYHILKNLDLDDLWNSRLISKRFYSIIKNYHINELTFLDDFYLRLGNWFTTTRPPRPEYQLPPSKTDLLFHPSKNLLNLKYLRIEDISDLRFRLDDLNKFTKLQILEIKLTRLDSNDLLQLPDLKALYIHILIDNLEGRSLIIDTPNLHSLGVRNDYGYDPIDDTFKFNHPLSIKYLRLAFYDKNAPIFTNLECLEIYVGLNGFESSDLLKFNNLKSLRINCNLGDVDGLKDLFRLKKNVLFVIAGVRIKKINKIDEFNSRRSELEFQLKNYGELEDDLHFVDEIVYDELVRLLPANQPDDLFTKLNNIQAIEIESRVEDVSRLIRFIRRCPNLNQLEIRNSSLDQQFYDQLPTLKSLSTLFIFEDKDLNLDFKFLIKMSYLSLLFTDQDVLRCKLNLNNFKYLDALIFRINGQGFEIKKDGKDRYQVSGYKKLDLPDDDYVNHKKLIEWSNRLRYKRETRSSRKRKFLSL